MLHTRPPSAGSSLLERCSAQELLRIFETFAVTGKALVPYAEFPVAWGVLFSKKYLSAEELVSEIQAGRHQLTDGEEQMLRGFIAADCKSGGLFVLGVIKTGGQIDRAALVMIADLADLARLVHRGSTALHLLAAACDRYTRPALIGKAGPVLLSRVFDNMDLPVLFRILSLGDLSRDDLAAIETVFTRRELKDVKAKSGAGRSALDAYTSACTRLKRMPPRERNAFEIQQAVRTTNPGASLRAQTQQPRKPAQGSGTARGFGEKAPDSSEGAGNTAAEKFQNLITDKNQDIAGWVQRRAKKG